MKLTQHTDYALRILMYLSQRPPFTRLQISDISTDLSISRNHCTKIVHRLALAGFLATHRGKGGGIELGQAAHKINIGQVIRYMENKLELVDCAKPQCPMMGHCKLKHLLDEGQAAFLAVLDKKTLADLI